MSIYEVSPRDRLQNEAKVLPLEARRYQALFTTGLRRIELSFVSPADPQLADADDSRGRSSHRRASCLRAIAERQGSSARARRARRIVFMSASETHNRKNTNRSLDGSLESFEEVVPPAVEAGMKVRAYVSTVWGCPYEGDVDPKRALEIAEKLLALGCYQVSLGDTIGVGTPAQPSASGVFLDRVPPAQLALHLHDTRGTALPNVLAGLSLGVCDFDASVGGLGGCPYAAGAAGNVATEDLVYMLHGMGIETGVDLERLVEVAKLAEKIIGRPLPGKVHQAGPALRR